MIHISPTLSPFTLIKSFFSSSENFIPNIIQFSYARGALIGAIKSIVVHFNINKETTVWAPSFISDSVIYLLEAYNIKVSHYPITNSLEPDWDKLSFIQFMEEDIFLLVHYFGFEMATQETIEFCKTKKLHMIEDCAHSIVPKIETGGIGTHGDAIIFGLRKVLPVPHGGFLFMRNIKFSAPNNVSMASGIYRSPLKMIFQWLLCKLKVKYVLNLKPIKKFIMTEFPENYSLFNFQENMDSISRKITNTVNINEISEKRISNYLYYKNNLSIISKIFIPISFKIKNKQTSPWMFFFFYEQAEELINFLRKNGIPAADWPTLHPSILGNPDYDFENYLYKRSVTLPVHQDVNQKDLDFIINKIKEFDMQLR